MTGIVVFSLLLLGYAAMSGRLDRLWITSAMVFVTAGAVFGPAGLGWIQASPGTEPIKLLAEAALALMLFCDAARIDLKALRSGIGLPVRLLAIGLPLTMLLGVLAAVPLLGDLTIAEVVLLAVILAPTDAALGQAVVADESVPLPVRQGLNVESGLNDGIAVPFYLVALEFAKAEASGVSTAKLVPLAAQQIGAGIVGGIVAGVVAGLILRRFGSGEWIETAWRQIVMFAAALLAYSAATVLGGSGFIAAFVGGLVFGGVAKNRGLGTAYLSEQVSALLAAVVFIIAGAFALDVIPNASWQVWLYALLSLTVIRMLPVAVASLGTGLRLPSVGFIGWFGPRGLASIIFGIGVLEAAVPHEDVLIQTVILTVVLSVFAHGLTAHPFATAYGAWYERAGDTASAEATHAHEQRLRLRPGSNGLQSPQTTSPPLD